MSTTHLLISFAGMMILGISAHMLSSVIRIPSIVLLLGAGIILGPEVTGLIQPERFGNSIELLIAFSVAIIVFDGGMNIDLREKNTAWYNELHHWSGYHSCCVSDNSSSSS